jgi:hypothetical protein
MAAPRSIETCDSTVGNWRPQLALPGQTLTKRQLVQRDQQWVASPIEHMFE